MYGNYPFYLPLTSSEVITPDDLVTAASCILAKMQRRDARVSERHDRLYAFCKYGPFEEDEFPAEGDSYASGEEWQALWDSTKRRVAKYELTGELY